MAAAQRALARGSASLLGRRGVADAADARRVLRGRRSTALHDPGAAARTRTPSLARIDAGPGRGERVMVFGDFDADGLTGLAILVLALRRARRRRPSRTSRAGSRRATACRSRRSTRPTRAGATLIVTVDCGTTSLRRDRRGRDARASTSSSPTTTASRRCCRRRIAIVNPHRPDSRYPDGGWPGSGVAFKVAQLLLADEPGGPAAALDLADLATIGTVADVAPDRRREPGDRPARPASGCGATRGPGSRRCSHGPGSTRRGGRTSRRVAFALAPRLNAAGRVGEALEPLGCCWPRPRRRPTALADALETANLEPARPDEAQPSRREAAGRAVPARSGAGRHGRPRAWPVGIVGLVASRLAEELGRPGRRRGRARATSSAPRAGATDRSTSAPRSRRCARPVHALRRPRRRRRLRDRRRTAGRRSRAVPGARRGGVPRRSAPALAIDLALPALDVDYALLPRARPPRAVRARATRSRSSRSSA